MTGFEFLQSVVNGLPPAFSVWSDSECILWDRGLFTDGYGCVKHQGKSYRAHRLVFKLFYGNWPHQDACHHCDTPACVNPHHLFDADTKTNMLDASNKGRLIQKVDHDRIYDLTAMGVGRGEVAKWLGIASPSATKALYKRNLVKRRGPHRAQT